MQFLQLSEELRYLSRKQQLNDYLTKMTKDSAYMMIEPPYFEDYDQFITMNPRIKKEYTVKLIHTQGQILLLRPDLTTSIIKHVLPKWNVSELKLSYLSTTFAQGKDGEIEEKKQFGIEYLGKKGLDVDRDVLVLAATIFDYYDLPYLIEINHFKFLDTVIQRLSLTKEEISELKTWIYYKNQRAMDEWLATKKRSTETEILQRLLSLQGSMKDILDHLSSLALDQELMTPLKELDDLMIRVKDQIPQLNVIIDLGLISDFDYYDGILFMGFLKNTPFPLLKGGRYDSLTRQLGKEIPAIGFTLNTTELLKEIIRHER